jgi:hypothetical protein
MGQSLAVQAALIAHFPSGGLLHVLVVDENAEQQVKEFRDRRRHRGPNPEKDNLDKVMEMEVMTGCLDETEVCQRLVDAYHAADQAGELLALAVCHDGADARNLSLALDLMRHTTGKAPVLVYLTTNKGFARLEPEKNQDPRYGRFRPFGMLEDVWKPEVLQDEQQDRLAKEFHKVFLDDLPRRKEKEDIESHPANIEWEQLAETFKNANRALADHVRIKLYTVGLKMSSTPQCDQKPLSDAQIEVLSEMEHARWCAERWLDGWSYDPNRDEKKKRHHLLLPWEELDPDKRYIDQAMMSNICTILKSIGQGVTPLTESETPDGQWQLAKLPHPEGR